MKVAVTYEKETGNVFQNFGKLSILRFIRLKTEKSFLQKW